MSYQANIINERLTMAQIIEHYSIGELRHNHMKCPFHNERTASFSVKGNIFKCFGCGVGGDVIRFIQMYFNLDFPGALAKLDADFLLGLGVGKRRTLRQILQERESCKAHEEKRKRIADANRRYWEVFEEWKQLDDWLHEYAPKDNGQALHPHYVEAIKKIEAVKYRLDCAEHERQVIERAGNRKYDPANDGTGVTG